MPLITRRQLVLLVGGAALFSGFRYGHARLARPAKPDGPLSDAAKALIAKAWQGLDPKRVLDTHVHVVGIGAGGTGCRIGARMQSVLNPGEYLKFTIYLEAAGITDMNRADQQYLERLEALLRAQAPHGRLLLLAFDQAYDEQGQVLEDATEFYTPNEYVLGLAKRAPDCFVACASVHPYRKDAVEALERAAEGGAVAVKWLPNAMNIDPSSERCDAFYEAMVRLQLPLITHAGEEKAVHAEEAQRLGNPLHLRRPLSKGVTVVVAHCASLGKNPDLDAPEPRPWLDNFELFERLVNEPKWQGKLFGEISAMAQVNRLGRPLQQVLTDAALQARCVNGSDYPLPAINALMQTGAIVEAGYLTEAERQLLNEIDRHDPLLFDFVLKRTVRRDGKRLGDDVFQVRPEVFPRLA
jgi:mannonate dehydratase